MKSIRRSIQQGFTLVELLIVVIILALLAAIVVPQFASSTDEAKIASLDTTLSNMRAAIDLYYQQHGEYPGANDASAAASCGGTEGTGSVNTTTAFFDQLTLYTDADGDACSVKDSNFKYGPYLKKPTLPANPITGVSILVISTSGDLAMAGDPTTSPNWGGWKYDTVSGKFIANDPTDPDGSDPLPPYDER